MSGRNAGIFCCLILTTCCLIGVTACSSPPPTTAPTAQEPVAVTGLPGLPPVAVPHGTNVAGGAIQTGDSCVAYVGGSLAPGLAQLDSTTPPTGLAWALYQFPEPLTPAYTVGVQAEYVDNDPFSADPRDGYWVAFGDYDAGCWEFHGPFTQSIARIMLEPGANVANAAHLVPVLVMCEAGNAVKIMGVRVGEDIGYGYEELHIAGPPGSFAGHQCDLRLDPAGNPQVLYTVIPGVQNFGEHVGTLRIARLEAGEWIREDLDLGAIENVRWARFAIGSGGRRAVLVKEQGATDDLHLFFDDGSGFAYVGVVAPNAMNQSYAGLTFVNKDGLSAGPLDRLVMTYSIQTVDPDVQTYYRTYEGAALSLQLPLFPGNTRECGRIALSTGPDQNGIAAVPDYNGADWHCNIGTYDAAANTWDFLSNPAWHTPTEPEWDSYSVSYLPDFCIHQAATHEIIVGYLDTDIQFQRFGRFNGVLWLSTAADQIPTQNPVMDDSLDFDVFTTGQAATLTSFGSASPQLSFGFVGQGIAWFRSYLSHDPWSMVSSTIEIDDSNNTHIAMSDLGAGTFEYYHRDATTHEITHQTIDNGGGDRGNSFALVHSVLFGDQLHLFYTDSANHRILRSVVENGIWLTENEPLTSGFEDWPYYVMGAGYLENRGLMYVAYMDFLTLSIRMLTGTPWGNDWEAQEFAGTMVEFASIDDDETNVGVLGMSAAFYSQSYSFVYGDPRTGPHPKENISLSTEHISMPYHLTYNRFNDQWCLVTEDDSGQRINYFLRTPMGSWVGPFIVVEELGSTAHVDVGGVDINLDDGTARVCVERQVDADPIKQIWVYSAPNGSAAFTGTQQLMSIDTTTHDFLDIVSAPTVTGEPLIAVIHRPIGDTHVDIRFFSPSAPDTWSSIGLWDTGLRGGYPSMLVDEIGGIYFSMIDMEGPNSGTLFTRYPW